MSARIDREVRVSVELSAADVADAFCELAAADQAHVLRVIAATFGSWGLGTSRHGAAGTEQAEAVGRELSGESGYWTRETTKRT